MKLKRPTKAENKTVTKKPQGKPKNPTLLERIEADMNDNGITPFNNENVVDEYLILPADITEVESKELGKYFNAFTQQKMWTRTLIGRVSTGVREMKNDLDQIKAEVYSDLPVKMSVKEKELRFATNREARETLDDLVEFEEKLKMLSDYLQNLEDGIFNISREISRRSSDWDTEKRADSISKKRR